MVQQQVTTFCLLDLTAAFAAWWWLNEIIRKCHWRLVVYLVMLGSSCPTRQGRRHARKVGGVRIGRSPKRGREAPEIWGRSPNRGRSPRKSGARGLGRGLGEPLPRKILKFRTSNSSIWCILETGILHLMDFQINIENIILFNLL